MGDKRLDSAEVCVIIEACAKHGVVELKFHDLELKFGKQTEQGTGLPLNPGDNVALPPVAVMTEKDHEKNTESVLEEEEISLRENQIAELQIDDPVAAEELIMNGELEDVDDKRGDDKSGDDE